MNQPELVQGATRQRVTDAMRALNYSPNKLANSLRSGVVKTVVLLVADITAPFHGAFAKAMSRQGEALGYSVVLRDLDNSSDRLISALDNLSKSEACGVLIALSQNLRELPDVVAAILAIQARGITVVTNSQIVSETVPAILPRFDDLARDSLHHLVSKSARHVAFLSAGDTAPMARIGREGFQAACHAAKITPENSISINGDFNVENTRESVKHLLRTNAVFQAAAGRARIGLICQSTRMATGAVLAAQDLGLSIPGDVAIVCTEELQQAYQWGPEITTVGISMDDLATQAFACVIAGKRAPAVTYLDHKLMKRASTAETAQLV